MSDGQLPPGQDGNGDRRPAFYVEEGIPPRAVEVQAREYGYGAYGPEDEIGLDEIFGVLRRRWAWVAGALLLALLAGGWWTWRQVPVWESGATVRVEQADRRMGGDGEAAFLLGRGPSEIQTEMRVLEARPIRERVALDLDLPLRVDEPAGVPRAHLLAHVHAGRDVQRAEYRLDRVGEDRWRLVPLIADSLARSRTVAAGDTVALDDVAFAVAPDAAIRAAGVEPPERIVLRTVPLSEAVAALAGGLSVRRPDPDASLLRVSYRGTDRHLTRAVPNAVTEAFLERRRRVQNTEARSTVSFLEEQTARISEQLEAAEQELQAFRESEQVVAPEAQAESGVQRRAELRARLAELRSERDALEKMLSGLEGEGRVRVDRLATFPTFISNETVQDLFSSLVEARQEKTAMLQDRTERHPEVVAIQGRIDQLEGQLAEIGRNYRSSLQDQIGSLEAQLARFGAELEEIPAQEVRYARLQRRTEVLTELHTMLQKRLKEAEVREAVEDPSIRVVESAVLPGQPVSPKPVRNMAFAGFLGLMLGVGLAFVREYTDRRIHSEEEVDRALGLPVLSRVPRVPEADKQFPRREGVVAQESGRSVPAESFRTLRTNVRYTRAGEGTREILVTSPGPQEGKSLTASNLAVTFAQQGNRTLLVDADLRKSVQHIAFGTDRSPGLAEYLVGDAGPGDVVRDTRVEHLRLVPAGFHPPNPAELLDSDRMRDFLERAREAYDAVVLDAPPVLPVTDASVLARMVEGVLVVIRADETDERAAEDTLTQLRHVDAEVLGVVFNDTSEDGRGYRGYYYYGYHEGDDAEKRGWKRLVPFS